VLAGDVHPDRSVPYIVTPDPSWEVPAIEDHALIGDTRTAALVTSRGEIDWLCVPRFESKPLFGALIGGERGGRFSVGPMQLRRVKRRYRPGTAILETEWETSTGRARLTDGLVADVSHELLPQLLLVRRIDILEGRIDALVLFDPRLDLGEPPRRTRRQAGAVIAEWGELAVILRTAPDLRILPGGATELQLDRGDRVTFVLAAADRAPGVVVRPEKAWELLQISDHWWRTWSSQIEYEGPSPEAVTRSLLTLRLLTYAPSGAPVAAPTTSLPEVTGGDRNWDYRFSWPRDASFGLSAFLGLGYRQEARAFLQWLSIASRLSRPQVNVLYDLEGRPGIQEHERRDVPGYVGSLPVRIGNAACNQHQLDVYGWVVGAAWNLHRGGERLSRHLWNAVEAWPDFVCRHWREADAGIWERRGPPEQNVHSKLMGWKALDRALRLADVYRVRSSRQKRWRAERTALAEDILTRGVDPARGVYVARYGSSELDAALLMLPDIGLEDSTNPRVTRTVEAIASDLGAGNGLLYRYPPGSDGLGGREGAFLACSFWLVETRCRLGRLEEGIELFESLCGRSNDVGLFAEQIDPQTGAHLGNFPQALTHSSLIRAALAIQTATRASATRRG
jgi:GH15 family glucan-1,4-alpha-glucosidase